MVRGGWLMWWMCNCGLGLDGLLGQGVHVCWVCGGCGIGALGCGHTQVGVSGCGSGICAFSYGMDVMG